MCIPLNAHSYAGQAFSENVGIGTAGSARKGGTPYRGTSQMSSPIKSLMSLEKGLFPPAFKGGGVPPKKHKGDCVTSRRREVSEVNVGLKRVKAEVDFDENYECLV